MTYKWTNPNPSEPGTKYHVYRREGDSTDLILMATVTTPEWEVDLPDGVQHLVVIIETPGGLSIESRGLILTPGISVTADGGTRP